MGIVNEIQAKMGESWMSKRGSRSARITGGRGLRRARPRRRNSSPQRWRESTAHWPPGRKIAEAQRCLSECAKKLRRVHGQSEEADAQHLQEARLLCRRAYVLGLTLTGQNRNEIVAEATVMASKMGLNIEGLLHVRYPKNRS